MQKVAKVKGLRKRKGKGQEKKFGMGKCKRKISKLWLIVYAHAPHFIHIFQSFW